MTADRLPLDRDAISRGLRIAMAMGAALEPVRKFLETQDVQASHLNDEMDSDAITQLSKNFPMAFAKRFFWKNLTKCSVALALIEKDLHHQQALIDLGCGPGTFTYPAMGIVPQMPVVGIDHNTEQLAIAHTFSQLTRFRRPVLIRADASRDLIPSSGLFTASYLVTELSPFDRQIFADFIAKSQEASFLIVDYINVIRDLSTMIAPYRDYKWEAVELYLTTRLFTLVGDERITFGVLHVPHRRA